MTKVEARRAAGPERPKWVKRRSWVMGWLLMVSVISRREIPCKVLWGKSVVSGLSAGLRSVTFSLKCRAMSWP